MLSKGVGVVGGVSPSPASASSISTIFCLNTSFSKVDIFWYACSTSFFYCTSNHLYMVSHIAMGTSLSARWALLCRFLSTKPGCPPPRHLPLQIFGRGCICLQRSPLSTQAHLSTGAEPPAPCFLAPQPRFLAHCWGGRQWGVRPSTSRGTPPNSSYHSPSLWPLLSTYSTPTL